MKPRIVGHIDIAPQKLEPSINGHYESIDKMIEHEVQFQQASPGFIEINNPGPITHMVLKRLRTIIEAGKKPRHAFDVKDYHLLRIDVKVHMLMSGWYPCIPGWHYDFITRDKNRGILPNSKQDEKIIHWMVVLGENIIPVQFLRARDIKTIIKKPLHWNAVNTAINTLIEKNKAAPLQIDPGDIIKFRGNELHQGLPAEQYCWRYFFCASLFPKNHPQRPTGTRGKIRIQQQVYLDINAEDNVDLDQ